MNAAVVNSIGRSGFVAGRYVDALKIIETEADVPAESKSGDFYAGIGGFLSRNNHKKTVRTGPVEHGGQPKVRTGRSLRLQRAAH